MIYKLYMTSPEITQPDAATTVGVVPQISFIFASQNSNYANFKKEILADEAQLQDAEGATMSAAAAKEFVATLP